MPVFKLLVYVAGDPVLPSSAPLASNTMCQVDPSHSTISLSPAIKSVPFVFFQASGPSTLVSSPISDNINKRSPACFTSSRCRYGVVASVASHCHRF